MRGAENFLQKLTVPGEEKNRWTHRRILGIVNAELRKMKIEMYVL